MASYSRKQSHNYLGLKITNCDNGITITGKATSIPRTISINIDDIFNNVKHIDAIEGQSIDGYGTDDIFIVIVNEHHLPLDYIKKYVRKNIKINHQITNNDTHYMLQNKFPETFSYVIYVSKQLFVYDEVVGLSSELDDVKDELKRVKTSLRKVNNERLTNKSVIKSLKDNIQNNVRENKKLSNELNCVKKIVIPTSPSNHINKHLMMISDKFHTYYCENAWI